MAVDQPYGSGQGFGGAGGTAAPSAGRKPSDGGLSGLGLIMQLVGGVMTAVVGTYGLTLLMQMLMMSGRGGMPGSILLFVLALIATSLARSIAHASAGRRLCYEGAGTPTSALKRYVMLSFVQTGVVALGLLLNDAPPKIVLGLAVLLAAWPIALLVIAKPKIAEYGDEVPMGDDKGFDGAAILLLIFGIIGTGISAVMLLGWLDWPSRMKGSLIGMGMLAAFVMLLIRSILHLKAGITGVKATHMAATAEAASKYGNFGVIAAFVTGGVVLLGTLAEAGGSRGAGAMFVAMLLIVTMLVWMLMVWPVAVRRFFSDRQFAQSMEERSHGLQQSSDRGLPTLGWLLLALGVFALASGLFGVLVGDMFGGEERSMRRMGRGGMGDPFETLGMLGGSGDKSPWFGIGVAALQIWAGVELIRTSERYKIASIVYGVVAIGVAVYVHMPMLSFLMQAGPQMIANPAFSFFFLMVVMALVVPVATIVFGQRKVRDAKAIAQTFE